MIFDIHNLATVAGENCFADESLVLAAINMVNLALSAWNNRKISRVRDEQREVAKVLNGREVNSNG